MGQKKCQAKPCDGTGQSGKLDEAGNMEPCPVCNGTGRVSSGKKRGEL